MSSLPYQTFDVQEPSVRQESDGVLANVKKARWLLLLISCTVIFGDYYCYDTPYSVKFSIRDSYSQYDTVTFNYLFATMYAFYDLPNMILPMINGYFASKIGNRKMMTVFLLFVLLGSIIFTMGIKAHSFVTLIFGRFVYGLGGDSLLVSQWSYIAEYFGEDKIGLASGLINMFMGLSESSNMFLSPRLEERYGLVTPFVFTTFLCLAALVGRVGLYLIERELKKGGYRRIEMLEGQQTSLIPTREDLNFPRSFYMVLWFAPPALVSYFGFFYLSYDLLEVEWFSHLTSEEAQEQASFYVSVAALIKTFVVVSVGYIADKYKYYTQIAIVCPIILTICFGLSITMHPTVPYILFGIGGALAQISLWSNVSNAVPEERRLFAAAVMYSSVNMMFAAIQYTNAFFYDITESHHLSIYFYIFMNMISLVGALKYHRETSS